jgi:hypothetical protein
MTDAIGLDFEFLGLAHRIELTDNLDEFAVAGCP